MSRLLNEIRMNNEISPSEVKKGDLIEIVTPWNFFRGHARDTRPGKDSRDIYTVEVWEVAAIGKKIMRLTRENGRQTFKSEFWTAHTLADGSNGFQGYVAALGNGNALAHELHKTDKHAGEIVVMTPHEAYQTIEF